MTVLNSNVPSGDINNKWTQHRFETKLINPANKRKFKVIVVGTGLAGASAASSLAELGYQVEAFSHHDSPRRAHSIAAQGGINAAKNYQNDGDSVYRLFHDTVKGGDFRSREANVHRLAEVSVNIIDQCVAQGVPFAREYGGYLDNRSFGGALVSRTFYARGQTGQQLLLGAYSALSRQIADGAIKMHNRSELQDIVIGENGAAAGITVRNLTTGEISSHAADAVVMATGGYSNVYYLSTNAKACNVTATFRAYKKGAHFANPCYTQIHPTCIPVSGEYQSKLTLMSESLRNDGRIWVPRKGDDQRMPSQIPESDREYYLEERYPTFGNLVPRDVASRNAKERCDSGFGVGKTGLGVYLDFEAAIKRLGKKAIVDKYGNLFEMYQRITGEDPYETPMRIFPAPHYTMGGLWVDYNLMTTVPGLFAIGEANFSDHGANRLGASALMQGLADGYFVLPYTIGAFLDTISPGENQPGHDVFRASQQETAQKITTLLNLKGKRSVDSVHRDLGRVVWDCCGMTRSEKSLKEALQKIPEIREEFLSNTNVVGDADDVNSTLEKAGRIADFIDFAELMCVDALDREESCGAHFREEFQTEEGEAKRNDQDYCYVSAWKNTGDTARPHLDKEELYFENVELTQRSYK